MTSEKIGRILAIVQIVVGVAYFSRERFNDVAVSFLMCLCGATFLMLDAKTPAVQKVGRILTHLGLVAGVAFVVKLLIVG